MPDRDVMTIGDLICYRCAKIIAKSAFGVPDGREAKGQALPVRDWEGSHELWGNWGGGEVFKFLGALPAAVLTKVRYGRQGHSPTLPAPLR